MGRVQRQLRTKRSRRTIEYDWVTRAAALTELDNTRLPMLQVSSTDVTVIHDLQTLRVLYCIVEGMEVYGLPPWEVRERFGL